MNGIVVTVVYVWRTQEEGARLHGVPRAGWVKVAPFKMGIASGFTWFEGVTSPTGLDLDGADLTTIVVAASGERLRVAESFRDIASMADARTIEK